MTRGGGAAEGPRRSCTLEAGWQSFRRAAPSLKRPSASMAHTARSAYFVGAADALYALARADDLEAVLLGFCDEIKAVQREIEEADAP